MKTQDLVVMGYVSGAFGVRGWVRIQADTEYADGLFDYPTWWIGREGSWQEYRVVEGKAQPKGVVAQLEGVDDRDVAGALRGCEVAIPRSALPETGDNEFYWADLIGMAVSNPAGTAFGVVDSLMQTGANDVLVVRDGKQQTLIPFVKAFILDVDLQARRLTVAWESGF